MEEINIAVAVRENASTKKELTTLRAGAKIPGIIYGGSKPPIKIALPERDILEARRKSGLNAILHLKFGKDVETVIVKELQRHPVTNRPVHADFQRISLTQKIQVQVPLHIRGEAPGVKVGGGILQHELRVLTMRALPTAIPQSIDVDISALEMGGQILVSDLKIAGDIEIIDAADHIVVHVTQVKVEEAAAPATPAAGDAVAAGTEPEVASTKGKKDEEGKVIAKDAKAAPAAEKGKEPAKKEPAKKEGAK